MLALSAVILFPISAAAMGKLRKERRFLEKSYGEKKIARKSTKLLEEGSIDSVCGICFGDIEEGAVAECSCGRSFHDSCAEPTSKCPYCGSPYGQMLIREAKAARCHFCGKRMTTDICSCGTVCPFEDGTFTCACGAVMHMSLASCPECGARYEAVMAVPAETV